MQQITARPLFSLGQVVATPGALYALAGHQLDPMDLLRRHVRGDWGEIHPDDTGLNERALADGSRIFSVYKLTRDVTVWVITEAVGDAGQRASTCLLLPSEY